MKPENKKRLNLALLNASEFIRGHVEVGLEPEDVNELDEDGLVEYQKTCERASKIIGKIAEKYK